MVLKSRIYPKFGTVNTSLSDYTTTKYAHHKHITRKLKRNKQDSHEIKYGHLQE